MAATEGPPQQRSGRSSPPTPFTPSFTHFRRCEQGIPSDRSDGRVWIDVFAPSWCVSRVTLESWNVEPARPACDVILSSLDGTRLKRVCVWRKRTGFAPRFKKTFPTRRIASPSDPRHPRYSKPRTRHHAEFRLSTCETRASESAAAPPHFVGIESAAHVDHILADQLSFANVHDPPHQTFRHWISIRRPAGGGISRREEASTSLHSR